MHGAEQRAASHPVPLACHRSWRKGNDLVTDIRKLTAKCSASPPPSPIEALRQSGSGSVERLAQIADDILGMAPDLIAGLMFRLCRKILPGS